ncbi:MAG: hypothetical protein K8S00_12185 [Bacteroidales bacterium]|nr:hypothetical protein [Bacteroidales bacterium]
MKKLIVVLLFGLIANFGISQVVIDSTIQATSVEYILAWDSSYCVEVENGIIEVTFGWELMKRVDGHTTKVETHPENYDISEKPVYINMVLSPQLVAAITGVLENRRNQLINIHY